MVMHAVAKVAQRVPGLKRIPVLKVLAVAEIALLVRDHLNRLAPQERRRLVELVRIGRGRPSNLSPAQQEELRALVAKAEPRVLAGSAVEKLSPVPLPKRLVYGPNRS